VQATVSFELKSATESLDGVYFPSMVVCNINALRASFILELLEVNMILVYLFCYAVNSG